MPSFDSLSFALLIPFSICFILVFIVCCFADEIKDICRLPSPLPSSYIGIERVPRGQRSRRSRDERRQRSSRRRGDDVAALINNEEGRSRNESESSGEFARQQSVNVINEQPSTSSQANAVGGAQTCNDSPESQMTSKPETSSRLGATSTVTSNSASGTNFTKNISICVQMNSHSHVSEPSKSSNQHVCECSKSKPVCSNETSSRVTSESASRADMTSRSTNDDLSKTLTSFLSNNSRSSGSTCISNMPSKSIDK